MVEPEAALAADQVPRAGSNITIVSATAAAPDNSQQAELRAAERRTLSRHLNDAALRTAVQATPLYLSLAVAVMLFGAFLAEPGPWVLPWIYLACTAQAIWALVATHLHRRLRLIVDSRRLRHLLTLSVTLGMIALGLLPSLASEQLEAQCFLMLLAGAAALASAFTVASVPEAVLPALLVPVALGLHPQPGAPAQWPFLVGGLFIAVLAAVLAFMRHHDWLATTRSLIELHQRIRAAEAERDNANRADNEKSRFLAIASHELRQPVHALGLFAGTLERRLHGSAEQPIVRNLIRAIEGLDRSFNTMLDISRLDSGSIQPNIQHFALRDLFRRLHMYFGGQAELAGLGLRFSPGGKYVSTDPQLLERIVSNLIQNAVKYTETGGVVVVARTTREFINVEVWDTGLGIEPRNLHRVFQEFYQAGAGAKTQGLGMGLAIVKRLCQRLGHELRVASRPGKGTMFRVGIRIGALAEIENATAAADTLPMPMPSSRTVLIIEDEEPIREGLRLLMEEWGYIAFGAASLSESIDILGWLETRPDLVISDLHLGDGPNGIAAINAVRAYFEHPIPAMLITGDTTYAGLKPLAAKGMHVMFKPVQPRKLHSALRELLDR